MLRKVLGACNRGRGGNVPGRHAGCPGCRRNDSKALTAGVLYRAQGCRRWAHAGRAPGTCRRVQQGGHVAESAPRIPTPADFLGPWRQMAEQAEQQWNQVFNQAMGTEAFAGMMGRYMEGYLAFQQSLAHNVERYMQSLNLPTRTDITAMGERLASIESQLSAMAAEQRRLMKRLEAPDGANGGKKAGGSRGNGSGA